MPASSKMSDLAFLLEDAPEKLLRAALIDYYLETRNFKAIEKLLREADDASSPCSIVWVWAMDTEEGSVFIPEQEMAAIRARVIELASSGGEYIADPYYYMDSKREELIRAYAASPRSAVYVVPHP
ncbi:hypothetical protein GXP70_08465 [Paenibacillus lycopersici]|uniref:Uncharacterized protein n=1 Tax=Paenibacillus lycopersici TaxID=2704462 RepID=A0A6C0FS46_9BACL|nr:hypothetical protein [Paenibacillus lycopersici]QHT59976.1 hypothetical protein GXP70_08465 [Paenibacillus lycopersici]